MKARSTRRGSKGNCLVECVLGGALLIPIALCMLDLGSLVLGAELNDSLARQAARAAANEQNAGLAQNAVNNAAEDFQVSSSNSSLLAFESANLNYSTDSVSVKTEVRVTVPFQFPFLSKANMVAQATMPVVAVVGP